MRSDTSNLLFQNLFEANATNRFQIYTVDVGKVNNMKIYFIQ